MRNSFKLAKKNAYNSINNGHKSSRKSNTVHLSSTYSFFLSMIQGTHLFRNVTARHLSVLILCGLILISLPCLAKDKENTASVSPWLYKQLTKAEKLIVNKSYTQAQLKLEKLHADVDKGGYSEATVLRSLSSVYALREKYKQAATALAKCLALKALPQDQEQQALLNLGQLYMATEQYQKAVSTLQPWLDSHPNPDTEVSVMLANAYAQLKQYRKALPYIKKAIASANKPNESWYQLNLAIVYELGDYQEAAKVLQKMLHYFPDKKTYWDQLAAVHMQLKQYKKATTIIHLAYQKGVLNSEKELLELVNLFLYIQSPYQAAAVMQSEMQGGKIKSTAKNWEFLANAWTQAREFEAAEKALASASKLHEKGMLYQQLGQIYVEQEKWSKAVTAFNKALKKGGLKQQGNTYILLGMSHYELKQHKAAHDAFVKAKKYTKSKKAAQQWLNYITNETATAQS